MIGAVDCGDRKKSMEPINDVAPQAAPQSIFGEIVQQNLFAPQIPNAAAAAASVTSAASISISRSSAAVDAINWGLPPILASRLSDLGISAFFPTQREVLPRLLSADITLGDICVCAPTGSGKTLTYVLPIVAALLNVGRRRLRALVLVPTRDLAYQVADVFHKFVAGTRLSVCVASGETSFASEQRLLGNDGADILIATPGRLADHMDNTPGFSLHALQFCVVDEADRLLSEAYQSWPARLAAALEHEGGAPVGSLRCEYERVGFVASGEGMRPPLRKIVCSATLTTNPQKLASLRLRAPTFYGAAATAAEGHALDADSTAYTLPPTLRHTYVVCSADDKPALLLHAVRLIESAHLAQQKRSGKTSAEPQGLAVMVFAGTTISAHRIARLLQLSGGLQRRVVEFSSSLSQLQRDAVARAVAAGGVSVLVCSDVAARGLDFATLPAVIQYDVASRTRAYVHRVGRTARAGAPGYSLSLITPEQMRYFRLLLKRVSGSEVVREVVPAALVSSYAAHVEVALTGLKKVIAEEDTAALAPFAPVAAMSMLLLPKLSAAAAAR